MVKLLAKNATPVLSRTSIRTLENSLLVLETYESEKAEEARKVVDICLRIMRNTLATD